MTAAILKKSSLSHDDAWAACCLSLFSCKFIKHVQNETLPAPDLTEAVEHFDLERLVLKVNPSKAAFTAASVWQYRTHRCEGVTPAFVSYPEGSWMAMKIQRKSPGRAMVGRHRETITTSPSAPSRCSSPAAVRLVPTFVCPRCPPQPGRVAGRIWGAKPPPTLLKMAKQSLQSVCVCISVFVCVCVQT